MSLYTMREHGVTGWCALVQQKEYTAATILEKDPMRLA